MRIQGDVRYTPKDIAKAHKRAQEVSYCELVFKYHEGHIVRAEVRPVEVIKPDAA